ncbi:MAG: Fic family protein [Candidatus Levybacteria bacterium]|nr:Fic family protein [Candidatus Levybacteria bacterium]
MLIPPKYFLTPKISELLASIEASRQVINSINIPPEVETNIKRQSILKSSLFSARIEGNNLTLDDLQTKSSKDQKKVEVFNILKGLNLVLARSAKDITLKQILELHGIVMSNLSENSGSLRLEVSAIFNSAGIAVYMPPPPKQIQPLIEKLLKFANSEKEKFAPIRAVLSHYIFEKIHPFLDGNGRVGRLFLQSILHKGGYGMKGMLSLEEYLDSHRASYYRGLENSEKDVTDYLEFMLEAISTTAQNAKDKILQQKEFQAEDFLLPRRAEILNIIKDQRLVNFDQIRRRFFAVNERTLRYDLKKLADGGLIIKLGSTKGVYYQAKE